MNTTLTIGGIWRNKKTSKDYELVGINKETHKVQLGAVGNGEGYNVMTPSSLRRNYTFIATSTEKLHPVETSSLPETQNKTEETVQPKKNRQAGRVELLDGKVIPGIRFLLDIAKKTEADTCKNSSVIWWLNNSEAGKAMLAQFSARVVYGKPVTK